MDIEHIMEALTSLKEGEFPYRAVEAAVARREEVIPKLLDTLTRTIENAEQLCDNENFNGHMYALYLLAQFGEPSAYRPVVELFSLPIEIVDGLTGDFVADELPRVLAGVSGGDMSLIQGLIENQQRDEFVRTAGVRALAIMALHYKVHRAHVMEYYATLYREKLERVPSVIWDELIRCATVLCPEELKEDIERADNEDLMAFDDVEWDEVEEALHMGPAETMERAREDASYSLIEDTVKEMEWWPIFKPPEKRSRKELNTTEKFKELKPIEPIIMPVRRGEKIGRNQPCSCGSGKKYKKCCGKTW